MRSDETSNSKCTNYPKYFSTMVFAMTLTGMWKSATDKSKNFKLLILFVGLNVFGVISSLVSLYEVETYNVYSVFEILIHIPLLLISSIGGIHMARKGALIEKLFKVVENGYDSFDNSNSENAAISNHKADAGSRFLIRCVALVIACAHFFRVTSTITLDPYATTKVAFIPLSLYFYKSDSALFYYAMYILQFSVSAACATFNVLGIAVCVGLVNIFSSEVDALKFSFEDNTNLKIPETNTKISTNTFNGHINNNINSLDEEQQYEVLKMQVDQHVNLIRTRKEIENLISPVAFTMFVMSEFIVCFCVFQIYQLSSGPQSDMMIIMNRVSLFAALMAQQFVYFIAGQQMETKSEELHRFLYFFTWYNNSSKHNAGVRIMFERTKVPFRLKAGYLIPINLNSFVTCMQATFSYFNLLRAMSVKNTS